MGNGNGMRDIKWHKIAEEYMFQFIIILAAICGMVITGFCKKEDFLSLLAGVSTSLFASAIVAIGSLILFRNISKRKEVCDRWGLDAIYELRQEANIMTNKYQDNANECIDIIGFGLGSWRNARRDVIISMIKRGVKIRIITAHPDNPYLSDVDVAESKMHGATKDSIEKLGCVSKFGISE